MMDPQKDPLTTGANYTWKSPSDGVSIFNDSGDFRPSDHTKNDLRLHPEHHAGQPPNTLAHISELQPSIMRLPQPFDNSMERHHQTLNPVMNTNMNNSLLNNVGSMNPSGNVSYNPGNNPLNNSLNNSLNNPSHLQPSLHESPQTNARSPGGGKPKSVSGTKRAAQNRSAQRAFRERREKYVKDLEQTALQVGELQKTIDQLRQENAELRGYTIALQSRLMELNPNDGHQLP